MATYVNYKAFMHTSDYNYKIAACSHNPIIIQASTVESC